MKHIMFDLDLTCDPESSIDNKPTLLQIIAKNKHQVIIWNTDILF